MADYFASRGYQVFLYDQRGCGYSGGMKGNSTVEEMHEDFHTIIIQVPRRLPTFIYCHSIGAAVVFRYYV